ncbi:putative receptor-type adenylate cyclase, partial [Trypanosoma theileri]
VFATNLPHWADEKTESETVRKFHASLKDEKKRTPLSLRAFAMMELIKVVLSWVDVINDRSIFQFFYTNIVVTVDDMVYGSFADEIECAVLGITSSKYCTLNYGATHISVWSMSRALNPTVAELFPPVTASMLYVEPSNDGFTLPQLMGVIIGALALLLLLVGVLVLLLCRRRSARDN